MKCQGLRERTDYVYESGFFFNTDQKVFDLCPPIRKVHLYRQPIKNRLKIGVMMMTQKEKHEKEAYNLKNVSFL